MKVVYLEWQDAIGNSGWFTKDKLDSVKVPYMLHEVGFLIEETKESIIFATTYHPAGNGDNEVEQWANLHIIPTTWLRNRIDLMEVTCANGRTTLDLKTPKALLKQLGCQEKTGGMKKVSAKRRKSTTKPTKRA
jgi:hypothetical protein